MDSRYRMLIDALDGTPRDLRRLLRPVSPSDATLRILDGACILDVLRSFAVHEAGARAQFERIIAEDHPTLLDDETPALCDLDDVDACIDAFAAERAHTTAQLLMLSQAQWLRTATYAAHGTVRLRTIVERLVARDNARLARIVDMRESLRNRPVAKS